MRSLLPAVLIPAALLAAPGALGAQDIPSPYRYVEQAQALAAYAAYLAVDQDDPPIVPDVGPMLGLRYTGRFAGPVAGVLSLAAGPGDRRVLARPAAADSAAPFTQIGDTDAVVLLAEAGLRLNLTGPRTWNSLAPYLQGTGGLVSVFASRTEAERELPENQIVDFGPSFAVGVSAGTDWFLTERLSVNAAAQGQLWRLTTPAGLAGAAQERTEWTRSLGVTLGAAFHF